MSSRDFSCPCFAKRAGVQTGTSHSSSSFSAVTPGQEPAPSLMAACWSSRTRSTLTSDVCTSRSMRGCSARNLGKRGSNQLCRNEASIVTRNGPPLRSPRVSASACSRSPSARCTRGSSAAPSAVSCTTRPLRRNRDRLRYSSSARIWRLAAPGVTPSASPARVKLKCSATATKTRRLPSGSLRGKDPRAAPSRRLCVLVGVLVAMTFSSSRRPRPRYVRGAGSPSRHGKP